MKLLNKVSLMLTAISLVSACSSDVNNSTMSTDSNKSVSAPIGKPSSAPISMEFKVLNPTAKAGEIIELEVKFNSSVKSVVSTQMTKAKDLTWLNSNTNFTSQRNKSGKYESLPTLQVIAPAEGVYYIRFVASVDKDGQTLSKPFIIPVKVGNAQTDLKPVGEVITDDKGQKVIIQKAETD